MTVNHTVKTWRYNRKRAFLRFILNFNQSPLSQMMRTWLSYKPLKYDRQILAFLNVIVIRWRGKNELLFQFNSIKFNLFVLPFKIQALGEISCKNLDVCWDLWWVSECWKWQEKLFKTTALRGTRLKRQHLFWVIPDSGILNHGNIQG